MRHRDELRALRKTFAQQGERARTSRPMRTVSRTADGAELQVALDGSCPERAEGNHAVGQVSLQPAAFAPASRGFSGLRTLSDSAEVSLRQIDRLEPSALLIGLRQTVRAIGVGFDDSLLVDLLEGGDAPDGTLHPAITVHGIEVLSSTEADLDIEISSAALPATDLPIAYN